MNKSTSEGGVNPSNPASTTATARLRASSKLISTCAGHGGVFRLAAANGDTFRQVTLGVYKVATMIKISTELLNDSAFNMEAYIAREFARRIGIKEEEAFFTGDGSKKPTGVLTSATVGKTAAAATTITFDDLIDLFYALREPYRARADFIANEDTVKTIRKLKDNSGHDRLRAAWEKTPSSVAS